jgi:quinol monooxygenase YgiN
MPRFAQRVNLRVEPGAIDAFRTRLLAAAAAAVREEPDSLRFEVAQDEEDPARFVLFEVYTDAAGLEHHHTTPHFLAFQREAGPLVLEKTRRRLTLLDDGLRAP